MNGVRLLLCPTCSAIALRFPAPASAFVEHERERWLVLPPLCPPCSAKVFQCVRLLLSDHAIVPAHPRAPALPVMGRPRPARRELLEACARPGAAGDWWTEQHRFCTGSEDLPGKPHTICSCDCHKPSATADGGKPHLVLVSSR